MAELFANGQYEKATDVDWNNLKNHIDAAADIATGRSVFHEATAGNAVADSIEPIQKIVAEQQIGFDQGIMGRGLTINNFNSSNALTLWKESFPYRFLVARAHDDGHYEVVAEYRLPINPQELVISTPYAIKTTITSQGVLEEHNGIPIKNITIKGTTGFWITRPKTSPALAGNAGILGTVFGGTIQAAQTLSSQMGKLTSTATNPSANANTSTVDGNLVMSGYFQYQLLRLFLQTYAITKTQPDNQDLRLVLDISKDQVQYLVTPQQDTYMRSVSSPMEYMYTINLLAWGTVPNAGFATANPNLKTLTQNSGNQLLSILNGLVKAQNVLTSFQNLISSVRADIQSNILGPLNNVILLMKNTLGVLKSLADFPKTLQQSLQNSVIANWNSLVVTLNSLNTPSPALTTAGPTANPAPSVNTGAFVVDPSIVNAATKAIANITQQNSGSNSFIGVANDTYVQSVLGNINLLQAINVAQLNLTTDQTNAINAAVAKAQEITNNQIMDLINNIQAMSTALEPTITTGDPLAPEWDILYTAADVVAQLYLLTVDNSLLTSQNEQVQSTSSAALTTTALSYWQSAADQYGIPYTTPNGKFSIPFPFRATLEQLANVYLKDATRWIEIASLNGLQYPYVDEDGFVVNFINNGSNNQFNIASATNLYVGQTIYLSSTTKLTAQYKIQSINVINSTNYLITVAGAADLSVFTVADNAQLKAYLPYTINSMKQIYIPSAAPANPNQLETKPLTFIDDDINLVKFSRIDWLLTPDGDLACTQNGFQNLAFGKTNLIQAATLKLITPPQGLILHPEYGALPTIGDSVADVDPQNQISRINTAFVSDERFNTPQSVSVTLEPGVESVTVVASVAQSSSILPIVVPLTN